MHRQAEFEVDGVEVWGCGGREARVQQEDWKEEASDARRRATRRALLGDSDSWGDHGGGGDRRAHGDNGKRGVVGGAAKEDSWILSLLGLFGNAYHAAQR